MVEHLEQRDGEADRRQILDAGIGDQLRLLVRQEAVVRRVHELRCAGFYRGEHRGRRDGVHHDVEVVLARLVDDDGEHGLLGRRHGRFDDLDPGGRE